MQAFDELLARQNSSPTKQTEVGSHLYGDEHEADAHVTQLSRGNGVDQRVGAKEDDEASAVTTPSKRPAENSDGNGDAKRMKVSSLSHFESQDADP